MSDNSPSYADAIVHDDGNSGNSGNPAWSEVLSLVPEDLHQDLTSHFQNWDKGVNERFQKIHEEYKPYKAFRENGKTAEDISFALGVIESLESNPLDVYNRLQQHLAAQGLLEQMGQEDDDDEAEYEAINDPRINELQNQWQTLADAVLSQQRMQAEAEEDAALDAELATMREKYGDYDEMFVLEKMAATGMDTEDAVRSWFELRDTILSQHNRPPVPKILGSAGAFPGQGQIDPKRLTDKSRRDLVSDMLSQYK